MLHIKQIPVIPKLGTFSDLRQLWVFVSSSFANSSKLKPRPNSIDYQGDQVVIVNCFGKILATNAAARKSIGAANRQCVGRSCHDSFHPRNVDQKDCKICTAIFKKTQIDSCEIYDEQTKNWFEFSLSRFENEFSQTSLVQVRRNITSIKQSKKRLERLERLERLYGLYSALRHTNKAIFDTKNQQEMLQKICEIIIEYGGFKMAWIGMVEDNIVKPTSYAGDHQDYLKNTQMRIDDSELAKGPVGKAAISGQINFVNDVIEDPSFAPWRSAALIRGYRAVAAVPLFREEIFIGVFTIYSKRPHVFDQDMLSLLKSLGNDISAALFHIEQDRRRCKAEQALSIRTEELDAANTRLVELSYTDQLTGLKNRHFLSEVVSYDISQLKREYSHPEGSDKLSTDNCLALLMIDLDHFKSVNDAYGHAAGDMVLKQLSHILLKLFRESDYVIRWGGEEFVIIVRRVKRHQIPQLAEKVRKTIEHFEFDINLPSAIQRSCSIGAVPYPFSRNQPNLLNWEETLEIADKALYAAKNTARNAWVSCNGDQQKLPCDFYRRISENPTEVANAKLLVTQTSISGKKKLKW